MGILLFFVFLCLVLYALLVTNGIYYLLNLILIQWIGLELSSKVLWIIINLVLWAVSSKFLFFLVKDARGSTPNMEGVWKFYLILNSILFLFVLLFGYKSK